MGPRLLEATGRRCSTCAEGAEDAHVLRLGTFLHLRPADAKVSQAIMAAGLQIEGVMANRKASTYQPGVGSPDWVKIKRACQTFTGGDDTFTMAFDMPRVISCLTPSRMFRISACAGLSVRGGSSLMGSATIVTSTGFSSSAQAFRTAPAVTATVATRGDCGGL